MYEQMCTAEINFKAEGWAEATFSSVSLPFGTHGGVRDSCPSQVTPVSSSGSTRFKDPTLSGKKKQRGGRWGTGSSLASGELDTMALVTEIICGGRDKGGQRIMVEGHHFDRVRGG
jgi:hypothetical protein